MAYHLLVADDEPAVSTILRLFFERIGYRVTIAADGQQAIELAQLHQPNLIMLDIQMPRMTGMQAVAQLRADPRFARTPIIAVTAYVRDYTAAQVLQAGFNRLVSKPFEIAELREIVAEYLRHEDMVV